jgi:hypothetical protein
MTPLTCLDLHDPFGTGRLRAAHRDAAPPRTPPRHRSSTTSPLGRAQQMSALPSVGGSTGSGS